MELKYFLIKSMSNNIKIPDTFPEKEKLCEYIKDFKKVKFYSSLGERLGFGHRVHLMRKLLTVPESEQTASTVDGSSYNSYYTTMVGTEVKVYKPIAQTNHLLPGLVYFHGGGWTLGSADDMDGLTRKLAEESGIIVVSVNYRMAPEHLSPAPWEDSLYVTKHILSDGSQYGIDKNNCAIGGDSAGGNIAAVVAQKLRDDKSLPPLKLQVLLYPAVQAVDFNLPSYIKNQDDPYLDRNIMLSFWLWYVQGTTGDDIRKCKSNQHLSAADVQYLSKLIDYPLLGVDVGDTGCPKHLSNISTDNELRDRITQKLMDPSLSPLLAPDLTGLPTTYIVTCSQDVLGDEGILYATRLQEEGIVVHHEHVEAPHAFYDYQDLNFTENAMESLINYVKKILKP